MAEVAGGGSDSATGCNGKIDRNRIIVLPVMSISDGARHPETLKKT